MREGDTLFLAMDRRRRLYFIVTPHGSTSDRQLSWLIDLTPTEGRFLAPVLANRGLDDATRVILDEIGLELEEPDADTLDTIIEPYGRQFPSTAEFSRLARDTLPGVRAEGDPDGTPIA